MGDTEFKCCFFLCCGSAVGEPWIGAVVVWLNVDVKNESPIIKFCEPDDEYVPEHSAFAIRVPDPDGEKYLGFVADFTIEQFGFEPEEWWMPMQEYLEKLTPDRKWYAMDYEERRELVERNLHPTRLADRDMLRSMCEQMGQMDVGDSRFLEF